MSQYGTWKLDMRERSEKLLKACTETTGNELLDLSLDSENEKNNERHFSRQKYYWLYRWHLAGPKPDLKYWHKN